MQKIKLMALVGIVAASIFGATDFQPAKADNIWPAEVIASTNLVRFEVQPVAYDAASNKYKYKFSWLMPRYRTYSFAIDGKMYMPRVTQNGVVETPFWFSPDITYSIDIFPYANGRGALVAKGSFKAPSVAQAPTVVTPDQAPALTIEEEYQLVNEYIANSPDYPKKAVAGNKEKEAVLAAFGATLEIEKFYELMPYLSVKSQEMFAKTPLLIKEFDLAAQSANYDSTIKNLKATLYSGKQHAKIKFKQKNLDTNKYETTEIYMVKENESWKIDFIEVIKNW